MKAMYSAFAATVLIAFGAYYGLHTIDFSAASVGSSANVRLD